MARSTKRISRTIHPIEAKWMDKKLTCKVNRAIIHFIEINPISA